MVAMNNAPPEPILWDVGALVLAVAETPVSDRAEDLLYASIRGDVESIIPPSAVIGAELILASHYGFSHDDAGFATQKLLKSTNVRYPAGPTQQTGNKGLMFTREYNMNGWDGYYAHLYVREGASTLLTIDDDFQDIDKINDEILLDEAEFKQLNDYLDSI